MRRPTRDPYARPAIQTLERLHAELGGLILENRQKAEQPGEQMLHVEAVIKMLDPEANIITAPYADFVDRLLALAETARTGSAQQK
jgi:hypothetical protein